MHFLLRKMISTAAFDANKDKKLALLCNVAKPELAAIFKQSVSFPSFISSAGLFHVNKEESALLHNMAKLVLAQLLNSFYFIKGYFNIVNV